MKASFAANHSDPADSRWGDDQWYVASWDVDDDQFVGKWGYHFSFDSDSTMYSQYSVQRVTVRKR